MALVEIEAGPFLRHRGGHARLRRGARAGARRARHGGRQGDVGDGRAHKHLETRSDLVDIVVRTVRRADIHQHLWPEALLSSLARRTALPRLRRDGRLAARAGGRAAGAVRPARPRPGRAAALAAADGLQRVLIAPSSPLGHRVAAAARPRRCWTTSTPACSSSGAPFELWAGLVLADPSPERVDALLDAGAVGLCLPAGALGGPRGLERSGPALERLARAARRCSSIPARRAPARPPWWPALTAYVAEMSAAWHAWAAWGRPAHPALRVVFAMLAGLAPLHAERLAARGGPGGRGARPADVLRHLLLRPARDRRDAARRRRRPAALRLRPAGRRAASPSRRSAPRPSTPSPSPTRSASL